MLLIERDWDDYLINASICYFVVDRREVESMNMTRLFNMLDKCQKLGKTARGKILLNFNGYEYTSDEIYEIPSIRKYMAKAFKEYNSLFYFLHSYWMYVYILCFVKLIGVSKLGRVASTHYSINRIEIDILPLDIATQEYAAKIGDKAFNFSLVSLRKID